MNLIEAAETRLLFLSQRSDASSRNVYSAYSHIPPDSILASLLPVKAQNVFDPPQLLEQIQNNIIAAKQAVQSEHAQPEYHFSMLLAHLRALPDDWKSESKRLIQSDNEPSLEDLLQAITMDIESSSSVSSRLWTFQALLRYAIVIYAIKTGHRSTGP
jgi:hypothetical protein